MGRNVIFNYQEDYPIGSKVVCLDVNNETWGGGKVYTVTKVNDRGDGKIEKWRFEYMYGTKWKRIH